MGHGATRLSGAERLRYENSCHVLSVQLGTRVTLQNIIVVIRIVRSVRPPVEPDCAASGRETPKFAELVAG